VSRSNAPLSVSREELVATRSAMRTIRKILDFDSLGLSHEGGFVADPFLVPWNGEVYVLFEVMVRSPREKYIGSAVRSEEGDWRYQGPAIRRTGLEFSFPFVLEIDGGIVCVPEVRTPDKKADVLRVYGSSEFPTGWEEIARWSIRGADPVVFESEGVWYLICSNAQGVQLYFSSDFSSDNWNRHPESPISASRRMFRMAGSPVATDEGTVLLYQDCSVHYGEMVRACLIEEISEEVFRQVEIDESPILCGQYSGSWNHLGMHHFHYRGDLGLAVVDGHNRDGWSIGVVETRQIERLAPAPPQFDSRQKLNRFGTLLKRRALTTKRRLRKELARRYRRYASSEQE